MERGVQVSNRDGRMSNILNGEEQRKGTAARALAWTAGPKGSGWLVHTNAVIPLTEGEHIQRTLCGTLKGKSVLSSVPSTCATHDGAASPWAEDLHDNDNDNDTQRSPISVKMKAWPYRQECRGHDLTKKNPLCC